MDVLPVIFSAIMAFVATFSAGLFIKKLLGHIGTICAFSAGFFISLSFFDLLPQVLTLASETQVPLELLLMVSIGGFAFLLIANVGFSRFHPKGHSMDKTSTRPMIGMLSTLEFCSHAFLEGVAIGVGFQLQFGLGVFVAVAVVSHDFCDGISTLTLMLNSGNTLKASLEMLLVDAFAPVLGAVSTLFFVVESRVLVYALSFLVGSFFYIGFGTLLPDAYRMNRRVITIVFFLVGFALVLLLTRMIG
jgi:ZIP family zinc transporter